MAKTNYNQAKRQKEGARKARQQEKLAKKLARVSGEASPVEAVAGSEAAPAVETLPAAKTPP